MIRSRDEARGLADMIALEGAWEANAWKHTCLLCWNSGESPLHKIENNGTCCLIRTRTLRFLAICAHVWNGYESFSETRGGAHLWLSLTAGDLCSAPSIAFQLSNPRLIAKDEGLDLATITFDAIDSLEAWRFHYLRPASTPTVRKGDIIHFLGFPGDTVRSGNPERRLSYCFTSRMVHDLGRTQFMLHDQPGTVHHIDRHGQAASAFRAGGESGAPAFKVGRDAQLHLAGIVSKLCSSGLTSGGAAPHETSDGDVYITYASFIQADGSVVSP